VECPCSVTDGGRSGGFVGVWIRNCVGCCLEEVFLSVVRVRDGAETTEEMRQFWWVLVSSWGGGGQGRCFLDLRGCICTP
jgi:hypothetical protein